MGRSTPTTRVITIQTAKSSQTEAKKLIGGGSVKGDFILVVVNQTGGYGRCQSSWVSCSGCLTFTFATHSKISVPVAANALKSVLADFKVNVTVKWPNDILCEGKKIAGVILEEFGSYSLVGVGVNLCEPSIYPSIERLRNVKVQKGEFLDLYLKHITEMDESPPFINGAVWFDGEVRNVTKNMGEYIVISDSRSKSIIINSSEYSYDIESNVIFKKI